MVDFNVILKEEYEKENTLSKYATLSNKAIRIKEEKTDNIRLPFQRDSDRIIHSSAYTRYIDKTQVYIEAQNDNISHRSTHVQFVSRTAKAIGRALGLNEDLIEAISLGHDIGHVPYGHVGERILDKILFTKTNTHFYHNIQSVRMLMNVENHGEGLNLTIQVLDGIMCHNGEFIGDEYTPINKTKSDFLKQYNMASNSIENIKELVPMSLEGCVVRLSDIIAYIGKDIEDAITLNNFKREDIPSDISKVLGNNNKDIMNTIVLDIVKNSYKKRSITMSEEIFNALSLLKKFNYSTIYDKATSIIEHDRYEKIFTQLFDIYEKALKNQDQSNDIYKYLIGMNGEYIYNTSDITKIVDYIAGMTDRYIEYQYEKYCNK